MAACHTAGRPCLHRRTPFSLTAALRGDLHPLLSSPGAFLYAGAFLFLEQSWSLCLDPSCSSCNVRDELAQVNSLSKLLWWPSSPLHPHVGGYTELWEH